MQCQKAQELFSDYIAGQTDRALAVSLENHLAACATCREEVAGLRRVWSSLDALPPVEAPPFFHENLMHRILLEQDKAAEARRWDWKALFRPRSPAFALAGLCVVALLGMGGLHTQHAALDPLGSLLSALHPDSRTAGGPPALQTARAEWKPNGQGGGTLSVHLQAQAGVPVVVKSLQYEQNGQKREAAQNDVSVPADHETVLSVPLDAHPASANMTLLLSAPGSEHRVAVPVTLMEPVPAPNP